MPAETMPALVWEGPRRAVLAEVPRPEAGEGQCLVAVAFAGICGTDLHIWRGEHGRAQPGLVLGHEMVGRLLGPAGGLAAGAPVFVNPLLACGRCGPCRRHTPHVCDRLGLLGIDAPGGAAPLVAAPIANLVALPQGLALETAALLEPAAVAVRAVRRGGVRLGDRVHVIGGGPIGCLVACCARAAGGQVSVSEPAPSRRRVVERLGFPLLEGPEEGGAAVAFDCTGVPAVAPGATSWVRTSGTLVVAGVYPGVAGVDLHEVLFRELRLVGTRVYTPEDVLAAAGLLASGAIPAAQLVSAVLPLGHAPGAFEALEGGAELKVLVATGQP